MVKQASAFPTSFPMRLLLFTDTLFDVNGVSRFILNVAEQSLRRDDPARQLHVATSTRFPCPPGLRGDHPTIHNLAPPFAAKMPGYAHLEVVLPLQELGAWPGRVASSRVERGLHPDPISIPRALSPGGPPRSP